MVYETVPEEQMIEFGNRNKLIQFLRRNSGEHFKAKKLALLFNFRETGTQVELRLAITEFIEQGYPIISAPNGFSWAKNKQQMKHYIHTLENRVSGINRRILSLNKCMEEMDE